MLLRNRYLDESTPEEMHLIDISLTNMRSKWNAINKDYKAKYFTYEANSNVWKQFHDYMEALSVFLTNAEGQLGEPGSSEDEAKVLCYLFICFICSLEGGKYCGRIGPRFWGNIQLKFQLLP